MCSICKIDLPLTDFNFHRKETRERYTQCKKCWNAANKERYAANKQYYIAKTKRNKERINFENQKRVWQYLLLHPCVDCGDADPVVLQFDHVRGIKKHNVSLLLNRGCKWEKVAAEIAKCDVRCASCHQRKTAKQFNWWTYKFSQDESLLVKTQLF